MPTIPIGLNYVTVLAGAVYLVETASDHQEKNKKKKK